MSHTPGPWHAKTNHFIMATEKDPKVIAEIVDDPAFPDGTQTANAHLIAAAPELLAALKLIMPWVEPDDPKLTNSDEARRDLAVAEAAIAKAEGTK